MSASNAVMGTGRDEEMLVLGEQASAVLAYLERRTSSNDRALALFRHTMLRACGRIDRLPSQGRRRQRIWLLGIAAKVLAELGTGSEHEPRVEQQSRGKRSTKPSPQGFSDGVQLLQTALPRLADAQRELVTLVHWDDLDLVEAAQVLGMEVSNAAGEYSAGRANLRAALEGARI
jgi:DNA-directed RNA polymerase specialized sigma24 family protein